MLLQRAERLGSGSGHNRDTANGGARRGRDLQFLEAVSNYPPETVSDSICVTKSSQHSRLPTMPPVRDGNYADLVFGPQAYDVVPPRAHQSDDLASSAEPHGYADQLSVSPGERIAFMVSTSEDSYQPTVVQLVHGDTNAQGPGFKERIVETTIAGEYIGKPQETLPGSYVLVHDNPELDLESFTLQAWVMPTRPLAGRHQGLLSRWSAAADAATASSSIPQALSPFFFPTETDRFGLRIKHPRSRANGSSSAGSFDQACRTARLYTQRISRWKDQAIEITERRTKYQGSSTDKPSFRIGSSRLSRT